MATIDPRDPFVNDPDVGIGLGAVLFAASMMLLIGAFQAIAGLVAIIDDDFYVVAPTTRTTSTRPAGAGST